MAKKNATKSKVKKSVREIYVTTDDREFRIEDDAEDHQRDVDLGAVFEAATGDFKSFLPDVDRVYDDLLAQRYVVCAEYLQKLLNDIGYEVVPL